MDVRAKQCEVHEFVVLECSRAGTKVHHAEMVLSMPRKQLQADFNGDISDSGASFTKLFKAWQTLELTLESLRDAGVVLQEMPFRIRH